jgi:hypothetical protein
MRPKIPPWLFGNGSAASQEYVFTESTTFEVEFFGGVLPLRSGVNVCSTTTSHAICSSSVMNLSL